MEMVGKKSFLCNWKKLTDVRKLDLVFMFREEKRKIVILYISFIFLTNRVDKSKYPFS